MDIAQLTTDIDRIKRMFSAILRYASRNKIHLPQVYSNETTHMGIKGCVLGTLDAGGLQGYFVKITHKFQSRSNSSCENFDLLNFHLYKVEYKGCMCVTDTDCGGLSIKITAKLNSCSLIFSRYCLYCQSYDSLELIVQPMKSSLNKWIYLSS